MKYFIIIILVVGISSVANASEKNTAIIGHVITQAVQGNSMDHSEILENEIKSITHIFTLSLIESLTTHLPVILDGVSAEVRLSVDEIYKCSLQGDYQNKDCK